MKYIGHSKVYYHGSNGYKLSVSDDGSFYSVYFDSTLPNVRIMSGFDGVVINASSFVNQFIKMKYRYPNFDPDEFLVFLMEDLKKKFTLEVSIVI